jgi:hypothetical protein
MDIIINQLDGSVLSYQGLADHLSVEDHLRRMRYEIFPDADTPQGDYDDPICCRHEDEEYADGEYDVAEEVKPNADEL